jgi:hypothetical protein
MVRWAESPYGKRQPLARSKNVLSCTSFLSAGIHDYNVAKSDR